MRGTLITVCGPMFAGKSTFIINAIQSQCIQGLSCLTPATYKHTHDYTRRGTHEIVAHDKKTCDALSLNDEDIADFLNNPEKLLQIKANHDWLIIDEIQFFASTAMLQFCENSLAMGLNLCCAGLNQDSFGQPFGCIGNLLAMSDDIVLLSANCAICDAKATKTQRLVSGQEIVAIGGADMYEPRCTEHWTVSA